ncbi:MAG: hypothetical protein Ta2B_30990 [Termitinemataceae bacterium]|nr:MAG: hypothetical protein Ta2B_30990 [Termitinemataceae bacterium]
MRKELICVVLLSIVCFAYAKPKPAPKPDVLLAGTTWLVPDDFIAEFGADGSVQYSAWRTAETGTIGPAAAAAPGRYPFIANGKINFQTVEGNALTLYGAKLTLKSGQIKKDLAGTIWENDDIVKGKNNSDIGKGCLRLIINEKSEYEFQENGTLIGKYQIKGDKVTLIGGLYSGNNIGNIGEDSITLFSGKDKEVWKKKN